MFLMGITIRDMNHSDIEYLVDATTPGKRCRGVKQEKKPLKNGTSKQIKPRSYKKETKWEYICAAIQIVRSITEE